MTPAQIIDMGGWGAAVALALYMWSQFSAGRWVLGWVYRQVRSDLVRAVERADKATARMQVILNEWREDADRQIADRESRHAAEVAMLRSEIADQRALADDHIESLKQRLAEKEATIKALTGRTQRNGGRR